MLTRYWNRARGVKPGVSSFQKTRNVSSFITKPCFQIFKKQETPLLSSQNQFFKNKKHKTTMNFEAFLKASRITDEEFTGLSPVDKSLIFVNFARCTSAEEKDEKSKELELIEHPQAEVIREDEELEAQAVVADVKVEQICEEEDLDRCYYRLIHSEMFQAAIEDLKILKYERNRCYFPSRKLPVLSDELKLVMTAESALWVQRLFHFCDEPRQPVELNVPWNFQTLFAEVFQINAIQNLNKFMQSAGSTLSASTFIKGYNCLLFVLKSLFGKHLSNCADDIERQAVEKIRAIIRDIIASWTGAANLSGNRAEKKRIQFALQNLSATERLRKIYFVFFSELYWFKHSYGGSTISSQGLTRAIGFAIFAFVMGRPANRAQFVDLVSLVDISDSKNDQELKLVFDQHKNARRTKMPNCVVAFYPTFCVQIFQIYLKRLRPLLVCDGWIGDPSLCFPANANTFLLKFFRSLSLDLTIGSIRHLYCQAVGESKHSIGSWSNDERRDLQVCAGHSAKTSQLIESHYEVTAKADRELLLQRYLDQEFFTPARKSMQAILLTTPQHSRRENLARSSQSQSSSLQFSSDEDEVETSVTGDLVWTPADAQEESPTEIPVPVRRKRAQNEPAPQETVTKRKRITLSLCRDLKLRVKLACMDLFRDNFLVSDTSLQTTVREQITTFFGPSVDVDSETARAVFTETRKFCKGLLKNWSNLFCTSIVHVFFSCILFFYSFSILFLC